MKKKTKRKIKNPKRFVLAEGNHWFYTHDEIKNNGDHNYCVVGVHDEAGKLVYFHDHLPPSQRCRLVLEFI